MSIRTAADVQQLYAELRSLAGDTRVGIDALVSAWYLEFRVRTSRTFSQWTDPALREIAAAVVFGADARPGAARLGARRALAGFSEAEVRDDLTSLAQTVATDPTLEPPPSDELLAAALAGWHATVGPRARPPAPADGLPGTSHLFRLLGRLIGEDSEPGPVVAVVDVGAAGVGGTVPGVTAALDRIEAAGPGPVGVGWFELVAGSRYAAVTRRTRGTAHALAVLRGALRVAPEFAGRPVHVWTEPVPRVPAALPAFVRGLTGGAQTRHRPEARPARVRRDHARPTRTRGRSRARHPRSAGLPERWLASAAALLLVVLGLGTLNVDTVSRPEAGTSPAGPGAAAPRSTDPGAESDAVAVPPVGVATGTAVSDHDPPEPPVVIQPTPVAHVEPVDPVPDDPSSTTRPTPAPSPPAPETEPPPGSPGSSTPGDEPAPSTPGPPDHAVSQIPDHAPPKAVGHPPSRARMTRM